MRAYILCQACGWGSGSGLSDSGSDSGSGTEELLTLQPRADQGHGGKPNPWSEAKVTRVTTPPPIEANRSYLRRSGDGDISAPSEHTVFEGMSRMRGPVEGEGLLVELEDKLKQATLSLTEAEREYIMEFGELPE